MQKIILLFFIMVMFSACAPASQHRSDVANRDADRLTVASVQREIKIGMSGDEVVSVLGSPNMITTDGQRRESWVYDKVSTERVYSSSSGGGGLILFFGGSAEAGASSTTQRTLTIIIKFDENGLVRDYSYRQSSF